MPHKDGKYVNTHFYIVGIYFRGENDLVSVSGRINCACYLIIGSKFMIHFSGSSLQIVSSLGDGLNYICMGYRMAGIDVFHELFSHPVLGVIFANVFSVCFELA